MGFKKNEIFAELALPASIFYSVELDVIDAVPNSACSFDA